MIQIKSAVEKEAGILSELSRSTFVETFAKDNSKEDMDSYVAQTFSEDKQLIEIQDSKRRIEIAWFENQAVGFLHLYNGPIDPAVKENNALEVLRLYVDSKWHGKNVGAKLMERCFEIAREERTKTLWLGVWEKNFRAQTFYKKYGFHVVGAHIFKLGNDEQTDLIMVCHV